MNDSLLGKMEATLKMIDDSMEEIKRDRETRQQITGQLNRALTSIHEFSDLADQVKGIIEENRFSDWCTTTELSVVLKVKPRTIRHWYETGMIPGYQVTAKGHIRFDRREVEESIKRAGHQL